MGTRDLSLNGSLVIGMGSCSDDDDLRARENVIPMLTIVSGSANRGFIRGIPDSTSPETLIKHRGDTPRFVRLCQKMSAHMSNIQSQNQRTIAIKNVRFKAPHTDLIIGSDISPRYIIHTITIPHRYS